MNKRTNGSRNNNEVFIEKYKELERVATKRYNLTKYDSPIVYLEKNNEYASYKKELEYCREVRNFLQHEEKINNEFAIIPSDEMIALITKVINLVKNPIRCISVCRKIDNIYKKDLNDFVVPSMLAMNHRKYTHIPILENGVVVGVFSKTSVFNFLLDEDPQKLSSSLRFKDIIDYISLDSENYLFVEINCTVNQLTEQIIKNYKESKRISMVFFTENGKSTEKLLGLLTPLDILEY